MIFHSTPDVTSRCSSVQRHSVCKTAVKGLHHFVEKSSIDYAVHSMCIASIASSAQPMVTNHHPIIHCAHADPAVEKAMVGW